ncbi:B-4DMT family transporter [Prauserella alba]|uniref:Uncharacterized protein n=1 Tax=Prauserella alba TaxID=176898 RepID=A0ABP4GCY9_9PSEU|nr:B-4DMT family transporter [Prauserella alba]MCP2183400.1 hypothetical protein [Prauserella alba]
MPHWVLRALGMSVLHAAATVALAKIAVFQPGETTLARAAAIALLVGAAALWGALDGWSRRPDGGRTWFIAGLVAGPAAGVLSVIGKAVLVDRTGVSELGAALTSGAAFTALLVLAPAALGLFVGSRLPRPGADLDADPDEEGSPNKSSGLRTRTGRDDTARDDTAPGTGRGRGRRSRRRASASPASTGTAAGSAAATGSAAPAGSVAPTPAGRDERNETVLLAKPRPDRRPRPTPRLRARRGDRDSTGDDRDTGNGDTGDDTGD